LIEKKPTGIFQGLARYQWALFLWVLWAGIYAWSLYVMGLPARMAFWDSILSNLHLAGACLVMVTILRYYSPGRSQYINLLAMVVAITFIWYAVFRLSWMAIFKQDFQASFWEPYFPIRLMIGFLVMSCFTLYSVLNQLGDEKELQIRRKTDAEKLARDAELFKLQQQLQPHFLFNSLNSISALVGSQPSQARTMIQQLSEFLRGTLRKNQEELVPLAEELRQLKLYLDIEKIRFGHRLDTHIQMQDNCIHARIPPLLLQPVMENAIKFGLYDTTGEVEISLKASCNGQLLTLIVTNPFDPETNSTSRGTGFGLSSVQRRLFLLFGRNDLLQAVSTGNQFITTMIIPQL
jgi:two-component system, LytTR family, sensor kinase